MGARRVRAASGQGQLAVGGTADICIYNPQAAWQVIGSDLRSQGKYTPFEGRTMPGRVVTTLIDGDVVFRANP